MYDWEKNLGRFIKDAQFFPVSYCKKCGEVKFRSYPHKHMCYCYGVWFKNNVTNVV